MKFQAIASNQLRNSSQTARHSARLLRSLAHRKPSFASNALSELLEARESKGRLELL